jgi:hypothetical protein
MILQSIKFVVAVFTLALLPVPLYDFYPSTRILTSRKRMKKVWYIFTMEYYSSNKKNEIMLLLGK